MKRSLPLALALLCASCVTLNEPTLSPQATAPGQRTILVVYPSPGPWVITDTESKAEAAAKALPVFSFMVESLQDERYRTASDDLKQYLPRWKAQEELAPLLLKSLPGSGFTGRFLPVAESEIDTATVRLWNRASDTLDWQHRYYYEDPGKPPPRDYGRILSLDDALVFEANLQPALLADDDGNMIPTLNLSSRLYRCQTMHLLWKHEDQVQDVPGARSLYEFKTLPQQLVDKWKALMPALAAKVSSSLATALHPGAAPAPGTTPGAPPPGGAPVRPSSATAGGMTPPSASIPASWTPAASTGTVPAAWPPAVAVSSPTAPTVSTGTAPSPSSDQH